MERLIKFFVCLVLERKDEKVFKLNRDIVFI
jgi:hypothetical protein